MVFQSAHNLIDQKDNDFLDNFKTNIIPDHDGATTTVHSGMFSVVHASNKPLGVEAQTLVLSTD